MAFIAISMFFTLLIPIFSTASTINSQHLTEIASWSTVQFKYNQFDKDEYSQNIKYDANNGIIMDSDYYKGDYYVTTPALLENIPATVSKIVRDANGKYLLQPIPDWSSNNKESCDSMISSFRIKIDELGRLWVIDSGLVDAFTGNFRMKCPPKLLAFDLNKNNSLIRKYVIPEEQFVWNTSVILFPEVQISEGNTYVYLADSEGRKMIVYHFNENISHKIDHPFFYPDPLYETYYVNGAKFKLQDGLFRMSIDNSNGLMYFHPLSSGNEYVVDTNILRKPVLTPEDKAQFKKLPHKKKYHSSAEVITKDGTLIFASLEENALYAWNSSSSYSPANIKLIVKDDERLQFITGMKIIGDDLIITSTRLQNVFGNQRNERNAINFRILRGHVPTLLQFPYRIQQKMILQRFN